jgi:hypothetical protein
MHNMTNGATGWQIPFLNMAYAVFLTSAGRLTTADALLSSEDGGLDLSVIPGHAKLVKHPCAMTVLPFI